jgi:hypothetical protein
MRYYPKNLTIISNFLQDFFARIFTIIKISFLELIQKFVKADSAKL